MKKRVMASILALCMMFSQCVWAEEGSEQSVQASDGIEEQAAVKEEAGDNQNVNSNYDVEDIIPDGQREIETEAADEVGIDETETGTDQTENIVAEEKKIYLNSPIMVTLYDWGYFSGVNYWSAVSEDEKTCQVECNLSEGTKGYPQITLKGIVEGTTSVEIIYNETVVKRYTIEVATMPEDGVFFEDIAVRSKLLNGYDTNQDGYISKDELKKVRYLSLWNSNVKSLSGLEAAENLDQLDLENNAELTDISPLSNLKNLEYVWLSGTGVSVQDKMSLADFKDITLAKGETKAPCKIQGIFSSDEITYEVIKGSEYITINNGKVKGIRGGEGIIHIMSGDAEKDITVQVEDFDENPEVGETSDATIKEAEVDFGMTATIDKIIDSNHNLWSTYPALEKMKNNVKKYVAKWVYYGENYEADKREYILDMSDTLWNGNTKLAENVESFDGRYVLDKNKNLVNIYNTGNEVIENVKSWISPRLGSKGIVYILKNDGTLWKRVEREKEENPADLIKISDDVKQLTEWGYLKNDGKIVELKSGNEIDYNAEKFLEEDYFMDKSGNLWFIYNRNEGINYVNTGIKNVKQAGYMRDSRYESTTGEWKYEYYIYALTEENEVYQYIYDKKNMTGESSLLLSNIKNMVAMSDSNYSSMCEKKLFQSEENLWYDANGNEVQDKAGDTIESKGYYKLILSEDGSKNVFRNDVMILTNVNQLFYTGYYYAVRTDGTLWKLDGVPEKVADLNEESFLKGDLDENGTVDIADLRMILRGVCEKIELTERQQKIADVNADGIVDIQDLRKELRYICGKIDSLD